MIFTDSDLLKLSADAKLVYSIGNDINEPFSFTFDVNCDTRIARALVNSNNALPIIAAELIALRAELATLKGTKVADLRDND